MIGLDYTKNNNGKTNLYLPEDFFRGEIRCDFFVSSNMKRYWAAQLEVLTEVDRICRKYDITYFADSGTLLGAVRHKGFIPWDDDIDIAMLRKDYNRFASVCREELDVRFVFAKSFEKKEFMQCFSRVYENNDMKNDENSYDVFFGNPYVAGIDIFPLDYIAPYEDEEKLQLEIIAIINTVSQSMTDKKEEDKVEGWLCKIEEISGITIDRTQDVATQLGKLYDNMCQLYTGDEAKEITTFPVTKTLPCWRFKKEWYDGVVLLEFEGLKLPCPTGYRDILTKGYGDYMEYKRGGGLHNYPIYSNYKTKYSEEWEKYLKKTLKPELSEFLNMSEDNIEIVKMLKYGVRNTTMHIRIKGSDFIFRIPGNKIENLANYKSEKRVYRYLSGKEIADDIQYISENNGNKISSMIRDTRHLDMNNKEEVLECLEILTYIHKISTSKTVSFDIWDYIVKYEQLWGDNSFFDDYAETKNRVRECYDYVQKQPKAIGITHFDLSGDNFLIRECGDGEKEIYIIDWEFSGIQDTHIDLAVFALYSQYKREDVDWLIDMYFDGGCEDSVRAKIYCYISVCALLFSNYYEYLDRNREDMTQEQAGYYKKALEYHEAYMAVLRTCS